MPTARGATGIWERNLRRHTCRWGVLALVTIGFATTAAADDWPQWLGPRRDGVWRESGILSRFPDGGPVVNWRAPIGSGYSGPAIADGHVFVMDFRRDRDESGEVAKPRQGAIPGRERVLCLDAKTGKTVWQHEYDAGYRINYPQGPRTTPAVFGGKVYTLGAMGDLLCLDAATGKLEWLKILPAAYGAEPPVWGWASHLLIDDDKVICLVGGAGSAVVAFDKDTGAERWRALTADEIGYSPPVIIEAGGARQLIVWLDTTVNSLDPATGKLYWSKAHPENGRPDRPVVTIMTPTRYEDFLLVSEFYKGSLMIKLDRNRPDASELWRSQFTNPMRPDNLNALMTTPVIRGGHIYGIGGYGQLRCMKAESGELVWESFAATTGGRAADNATAFLVEHDDHTFVFNDRGDLIIAKMTPDGFEEIDRAHLLKPTGFARGREVVWSHPAFASRCIFARNDEEIICVSLAATNLN
jgi:outer membrane protein assembly factor BamB